MTRRNSEAQLQVAGARHGRLRASNSWANAGRVLVTLLIVVVLSGVSVGAYALWGITKDLKTVDLPASDETALAVGAGAQSLDGELTILLVGSDSRAGQSLDDGETGELNDVNLLLHVSADHKNATVISFPRDLMVPIPSCPGPKGEPNYYPAMSEQMINSTLAEGGLPCVAATITELTGIPIPYAAMITFDGVIEMSSALGGVTVCLTEPITDPMVGLNLPAGDVTLEGYDALQFLRTRYGVGDGGDTSRISNQQMFMSALVKQLKGAATLSNPLMVYNLAKAGVQNMTLSSNMASVQFMQAVAGTVKDIDLEHINFVQYPSFGHPYQPGRLTPDRASATVLINTVMSGEPFQVVGTGKGIIDQTAPTTPAPTTPVVPSDPSATTPTDPSATATPTPTPTPTKLPDNITGLNASSVACSAGRTDY